MNTQTPSSTNPVSSHQSLKRVLGTKESLAIFVGTIIGTGVFIKSGSMAQKLPSALWVLIAWTVAGLLSLVGALVYAELGSRFPEAGGEAVYLERSYGRLAAFLYGWMRFWIASPGSIAAYAVGATSFLTAAVPSLSKAFPFGNPGLAISFILFFSLLNTFSTTVASKIISAMTSLKTILIVFLTLGVFIFSETQPLSQLWSSVPPLLGGEGALLGGGATNGGINWPTWSAFSATLVAALWAYDGWNNLPMMGGEIKDPEKTFPKAMWLGTLIILALYLSINLSYFLALDWQTALTSSSTQFPEAEPIATKAAQTFMGKTATMVLGLTLTWSALGAMSGSILSSARVPFFLAQNGLFFKSLGELNPKTQVPLKSLWAQTAVAVLLAMSGSFDQLSDAVVFASWIFYALCGAAVFKLRKSESTLPKGVFSFGFPWLNIIFVLFSIAFMYGVFVNDPKLSIMGSGFILAGIPVYWLLFRKK